MSNEKNINSRIIHKHDTEANWLKATGFIPKLAELIVYEPDEKYNYSRYKIGDGVTAVNDLPFSNVQPDWNQIDPNAADYVKNKTHYESIKRQFVTNAFLPFRLSTDNTVWYTPRYTPSYFQYETGTILVYKLVTITDHVETTIAEYVAEIRERGVSDNTNVAEKYVGNAYLKGQVDNPGLAHDEIVALGYPDTGEHFYRGEAYLIFSDVSILSGTKADIGIYKYTQISVVKKLDEKYIPNTIARTADLLQSDWEQTDDTKLDFIKNKPDVITPDMILQMLDETGAAQPIADVDNSVLTTEDNKILIL